MKIFVTVLIILVLLGGTAFYFGWVQFQLPENTYAVIFTKTGGWDDHTTSPGSFVWRWERLIPTNFTMHKFTLSPYTASINSSGELPSGDVYRQILEPKPDFSFFIKLTVSFQIDPESLPELVSSAALSEESFGDWHEETRAEIAAKAADFVRSSSTSPGFTEQLDSMGAGLSNSLMDFIENSFPHVTVNSVSVIDIKAPDYELYQVAKELYIDLARKRTASYEAALKEISWTEARTVQHFNVIEKYGELITNYPALLELFALKGGELGTILEEIDAFAPGGTPAAADSSGE